jgi:hypothetical protein
MNSINSNNVNFTAKMDVRSLTKNKSQWQAIAKRFEEQTQKKLYDFELERFDDEISLFANNPKNIENEHLCTISSKGEEKLLKLPLEKAVNKLKKLLDLLRHDDKTDKIASDLMQKLERNDKYHTLDNKSENHWGTLFEQIHGSLLDKKAADRAKVLQNDEVLKEFKVEY